MITTHIARSSRLLQQPAGRYSLSMLPLLWENRHYLGGEGGAHAVVSHQFHNRPVPHKERASRSPPPTGNRMTILQINDTLRVSAAPGPIDFSAAGSWRYVTFSPAGPNRQLVHRFLISKDNPHCRSQQKILAPPSQRVL